MCSTVHGVHRRCRKASILLVIRTAPLTLAQVEHDRGHRGDPRIDAGALVISQFLFAGQGLELVQGILGAAIEERPFGIGFGCTDLVATNLAGTGEAALQIGIFLVAAEQGAQQILGAQC